MEAPHQDRCERCGRQFLETQICDSCRTPAEALRAAALVIRNQSPGSLLVPWLEWRAARLERRTAIGETGGGVNLNCLAADRDTEPKDF